jgi:CTP synthase
VISLLAEQRVLKELGGTMRLGSYPCRVKKHTLAAKLYRQATVHERHRHRYEFNNAFKKACERKGLVFSGICPRNSLVEIIELKGHVFFIAVQFHPEFVSKPHNPHPLFSGFIHAALRTCGATAKK